MVASVRIIEPHPIYSWRVCTLLQPHHIRCLILRKQIQLSCTLYWPRYCWKKTLLKLFIFFFNFFNCPEGWQLTWGVQTFSPLLCSGGPKGGRNRGRRAGRGNRHTHPGDSSTHTHTHNQPLESGLHMELLFYICTPFGKDGPLSGKSSPDKQRNATIPCRGEPTISCSVKGEGVSKRKNISIRASFPGRSCVF